MTSASSAELRTRGLESLRPITVRRAAELAERGLEAIAGRRNIVRASRFVLDRARLDGPNRIETNGELNVQQLALRTRMPGPVNVIDVGAHFGEWSGELLRQAEDSGGRSPARAYGSGGRVAGR